jgi:outer membrane receptor protein involved in Fe transport
MNIKTTAGHLPLTIMLTAGLFTTCWLQAQSVPAPSAANEASPAPAPAVMEDNPPPSPDVSDDVVIMSPFEVRTERDQGFVAASMLTGGRLATDLKDTPIAYTVLTREFIDAMQLADLSEMHEWSTNTQSTKRDGTQYGTGETVSIRSRGIGTSIQKNFFPVNYNFDGYNLERLDLARGPNAVLFGSNSLGGAVNSVTKRALIGKRRVDVRAAYGSWGNLRTTLDYNQPAGKNLSFRVNALWQERDGWRTTDYSETRGLTLAGTLKLSRDTEIRMEVEQGKMKRSITANFMDQLSAWDGHSFLDARSGQPGNNAVGDEIGIGRISTGRGRLIYTPSLDGRLINYAGWGLTFAAGARSGSLAAGVPFGGMDTTYINGKNIREQQNLPADLYDNAINNSHFRIPGREFSSFTNEPIYGVENSSYTVSLTQRVGRSFFVELALNRQSEYITTDMGIGRGMANVYIDINKKTPEGDDNTNYLQPYAQHDSNPSIKDRDRVNARLALGYVLDGGSLGNFTFSLMGGVSNSREVSELYWYALKMGADPRKWTDSNGSTAISYRYYFYTDQPRTRPMPGTWRFVDPVAGTETDVPAGLVRDFTNSAQNQISKIDYTYIQAATNAKLFKNRLSLVLAARYDRYKTRQEALDWLGNFPLDWDGTSWRAKPAAPEDYGTWTYRARDADGIPYGAGMPAEIRPRELGVADIRYADDRFQDDYSPPEQKGGVTTVSLGTVWHATRHISPFMNFAQSFVPPSGAFRLNGSLMKHRSSQGWDAGLRFTLLDGRMVTNVSYYQGREKNAGSATTGFGSELPKILKARPLGENYTYNKYLPLLPTGFTDVCDRETEGFEFEITANLTKNWRLLFNAALPKTWDVDAHKDSLAYYNANKATLIKIIREAGGSFDAAEKFASTGPGIVTDGETAVTAWNTIQNTLDTYSDRMPTTRVSEATANLFTDYAFSRGFLKGVSIGGGFNYRGRQKIGFKGADTIADPDNPGAVIDDPSVGKEDAVYLDSYYLASLVISYKRRILKNKAELVISLTVNNALDYDNPVYYSTVMRPPGGDVSSPARAATPDNYYWETPRNFLLTARLLF